MSRICVFAKAPVAGQVKTRLASALGDDVALTAHIELVERTLASAAQTGHEVELWIGSASDQPLVDDWCHRYALRLIEQPEGDLGARMQAAMDKAASEQQAALIVGTDIPALTADYLLRAISALKDADLVLGPVEDGGYCLIGAKQTHTILFHNMRWSTSGVFAETVRRARAAKLRLRIMPQLWDVDLPADWERYLIYKNQSD